MLVTQSCLTLCDPMDCSLPGSCVHGILQRRVTIPFSRGSSRPRDQTHVSRIVGRFFTVWATREALRILRIKCKTQVALLSCLRRAVTVHEVREASCRVLCRVWPCLHKNRQQNVYICGSVWIYIFVRVWRKWEKEL